MKVEVVESVKNDKLLDLDAGSIFEFDGDYYIKSDRVTELIFMPGNIVAVNLVTGKYKEFNTATKVRAVNAKLVVE